jgi:hypothetical protein
VSIIIGIHVSTIGSKLICVQQTPLRSPFTHHHRRHKRSCIRGRKRSIRPSLEEKRKRGGRAAWAHASEASTTCTCHEQAQGQARKGLHQLTRSRHGRACTDSERAHSVLLQRERLHCKESIWKPAIESIITTRFSHSPSWPTYITAKTTSKNVEGLPRVLLTLPFDVLSLPLFLSQTFLLRR